MLSLTFGALEAVTTQLACARGLRHLLTLAAMAREDESRAGPFTPADKRYGLDELVPGFKADLDIVQRAVPFAWTRDTVRATLAASQSIPLDTELTGWNLPSNAVWWHFEQPLPAQTVTAIKSLPGVRALTIGLANPQYFTFNDSRLLVSAWCDPDPEDKMALMPSQIFTWRFGSTLAEMLVMARQEHRAIYGPGGRWEHRQGAIIGEDAFILATETLARFVLAGTSWINSKIVASDVAHVERHRRKEYARTFKREPQVRLVQLRRVEHVAPEDSEADAASGRQYTCQWQVDGHWRNQHVGPGLKETRLTWVSPHIRGPEDKPFKVPARKVYVVSR